MVQDLIELFAKDAVHAWYGNAPELPATQIDFESGPNFRLSASLHQRFDVVWLVQAPITDSAHTWRGILDEAVRLIGESGHLVVRCPDQDPIMQIKAILGRIPSAKVSLVTQTSGEDRLRTAVFRVRRTDLVTRNLQTWTIGILSDGRKTESVKALVRQIDSTRGGRQVEFLIAGPKFPIEASSPVRFLQTDILDNLPRIGEKKARIVEQANHENIAIFHDRYVADENFFSGFDRYGYDFDFVTIEQRYESGAPFPGYTGLPERKLALQMILYTPKHDRIFEGHYLNGGLIVLKASLAKKINFNPLLLHFEAEDLELALLLADYGVIPRINIYSSATTIGTPESYTETFKSWTPTVVQDYQREIERLSRPSFLSKCWMLLPVATRRAIKASPLFQTVRKRIIRGSGEKR